MSWFSFLPFYSDVEHAAAKLSKPVNDEGLTWYAHQPIDVQHVFGFAFVVLLLTVIGILITGALRDTKKSLIPEDKLTLRTFMELFVTTTYKMVLDIVGSKKAARFFLPLIGTCALLIFFSNFMGLVPGFLPPTDKMDTTLAMALVIFAATHVFGLKENGFGHIKHLFGPVIWLAPLMFVIEVISHLARPMSLSIRLMANMAADHAVVGEVSSLVAWIVPAAPLMLGSLVCIVQTLVFCLLSTVYIGMAIAHDH